MLQLWILWVWRPEIDVVQEFFVRKYQIKINQNKWNNHKAAVKCRLISRQDQSFFLIAFFIIHFYLFISNIWCLCWWAIIAKALILHRKGAAQKSSLIFYQCSSDLLRTHNYEIQRDRPSSGEWILAHKCYHSILWPLHSIIGL